MESIVNLLRLNVVLLVLMVLLLAGAWVLRRDPEERNLELLPDMQYSPAYSTYSPAPLRPDGTPIFSNGQIMQTQPAGTIARGGLALHADDQIIPRYEATLEGAKQAGEELTNPVDMKDADVLARGQELYRVFCSVCHDPQGLGKTPVTDHPGYPPPPSLVRVGDEEWDKVKDGQLYHIITYGGQRGMASYESQISSDDRWRVIAYVRDMQSQAAPTDAENDTESETDAPPNDEPQK